MRSSCATRDTRTKAGEAPSLQLPLRHSRESANPGPPVPSLALDASADLIRGSRGHLLEFRQRGIGMIPRISAFRPDHQFRLVSARIVEACGADEQKLRHGAV